MKYFFFLLFLSLYPGFASAQKQIKLSSTKSNKVIKLSEGSRVIYTLHTAPKPVVGILNNVQEDSITISNRTIALADLSAIGKRKKGTVVWSTLMAAFGGAMVGSALAPDPDPCPSCQTVIVEDKGGTEGDIILVAGGFTLIGLAINKAVNNSARNIANGKWTLEVISAD